MADIISSKTQLKFDFRMQDSLGTTGSRTLSVDYYGVDGQASIKGAAFRDFILNNQTLTGMDKFVQPTGWRDSDTTAEEYQTTEIYVTRVFTESQTFDYSDEETP